MNENKIMNGTDINIHLHSKWRFLDTKETFKKTFTLIDHKLGEFVNRRRDCLVMLKLYEIMNILPTIFTDMNILLIFFRHLKKEK